MDVVGECALALDLHDGQPLAVASLEPGITADVDLLELERMLAHHVAEHRPGPVAEVATGGGVQRDARYG
jgi:hypothetical protein